MLYILLISLCESLEYAKLHGSVETLHYYYVDIWVGTPQVKETVIVATATDLTSFPCMTCRTCGRTHFDSFFNYTESSTSRLVSCSEDYSCNPCSDGQCGYNVRYMEGSSISGILVEDMVKIGDTSLNEPVRMIFGCHSRETDLIRDQLADGIMGLAHSNHSIPLILDALYEDKDIDNKVFSICLGMNDGYMTVGGYNDTQHNTPIKWTKMYGEKFYSANLDQMYIDGVSLERTSDDFSRAYTTHSILDSGTTFVYFTRELYTAFWNRFLDFCSSSDKCGTNVDHVRGKLYSCYRYDKNAFSDIEDFFDTFPVIGVSFEGENVNWIPKNYLFAEPENPLDYCVGVYENESSENDLGALFMRGLDVVFDRTNMKLGFASSDCDSSFVDSLIVGATDDGDSSQEDENSEENEEESIILIRYGMLLAFLGIFLILLMYLCCRRRNRQFRHRGLSNPLI